MMDNYPTPAERLKEVTDKLEAGIKEVFCVMKSLRPYAWLKGRTDGNLYPCLRSVRQLYVVSVCFYKI